MIKDSLNMRLVGHEDLGGTGDCMHVNVEDGYAYLGHMGYNPDIGTSIVDVSDPSDPGLVNQISPPAGTHSHKVQINEGLLLVNHERNRFEDNPPTWSAGLAVYSLDDPEKPEQIGFWETGGTGVHRTSFWEPPYAYVSASADGFLNRFLHILDLSDPTDPTEVGRWWYPGQHVAGGETPGWDREHDQVQLHHALSRGDRVYGGWWDAGLVIIDVSDPTDPQLVANLDFGEDSGNTHTALPVPGREDLLAVTDEQLSAYIGTQRHVRLVDISDERNPEVISRLPVPDDAGEHHRAGIRFGPHNLHEPRPGSLQDPDVLYLTYFAGGLRAYDISDPTAPREIAYIVPEAPEAGRDTIQINDVTVDEDGLIYASDRHGGGLYVFAHDR